jgi:hypothetical protein
MAPAPAPTAPRVQAVSTPVTVANVCSFNRGLGQVHLGTVAEGFPVPTAYWWNTNNQATLYAFATDSGSSTVNLVVIPTVPGGGTPAWVARCGWPAWISFAEWQQRTQLSTPAALSAITTQDFSTAINLQNDTIAGEIGAINPISNQPEVGSVVPCYSGECVVE